MFSWIFTANINIFHGLWQSHPGEVLVPKPQFPPNPRVKSGVNFMSLSLSQTLRPNLGYSRFQAAFGEKRWERAERKDGNDRADQAVRIKYFKIINHSSEEQHPERIRTPGIQLEMGNPFSCSSLCSLLPSLQPAQASKKQGKTPR